MSGISWCPLKGEKIAISYCCPVFEEAINWTGQTAGYVFDITNPTQHLSVLTSPSPLTSIQYNPKEPSIVAAGSYNGQVAFWDVRTHDNPVGVIKLAHSHSEPVYSTVWTASKTNSEIMTASPDGTVRWWDTRNFTTANSIVDLQENTNKDGSSISCSPSILEYEATIPSRYMVGTEQGKVLCCDRKAKDPSEVVLITYKGHWGPIRALERNPSFPKNFLTVGDRSIKVWSDDVNGSPLFWVWSGEETLTMASWSPARPSVIFGGTPSGPFLQD